MVARDSTKLESFDTLLVVGADVLRQYMYHEPSRPIPENIRIVHIDEDPWQLNKNYVCEAPVLGHPQAALRDLAEELEKPQPPTNERS